MIDKDISNLLVGFIESTVSSEGTELYEYENRSNLKSRIEAFDHFSIICGNWEELKELIKTHVPSKEESIEDYYKWQLIIATIEDTCLNKKKEEELAEAKEESEESEEDTEQDQDEDDDDDEEDVGLSASKATMLIGAIKKDYSYSSEIQMVIERIVKRSPTAQKTVNIGTSFKKIVIKFFASIKEFIGKILQLLGLSGILITIARLMEKSKPVRIVIKTIGTVLVLMLFVTFFIIVPLYRFARNPSKIFDWIFDKIDIDIPDE